MGSSEKTSQDNSGGGAGLWTQKLISAGEIRPRLMFQVASELVAFGSWPYRAPYLEFRSERGEPGSFRMYCNANLNTIQEVTARKLDISILNPEVTLKMAYQGSGPFDRPHPLATITNVPHYDQLGFAVTEESGITSLDQIRERRYPLRVSTRSSLDLSTGLMANEVLKTHGFSFSAIRSWGGHVSYDHPMPDGRLDRVKSGELEAIFDEGLNRWVTQAVALGMRFLPIGDEHYPDLEAKGFKRGIIAKALYPTLEADVQTIDFSGWPIFTHREAPDLLITHFCAALEARKHVIQWQPGDAVQPPLPLDRMCRDGKDTPLNVPLHPAAERFWRERGYLA